MFRFVVYEFVSAYSKIRCQKPRSEKFADCESKYKFIDLIYNSDSAIKGNFKCPFKLDS